MNCRELHHADDLLMNAYRKFFEFMTNEGRNEFCLNWYEYTNNAPEESRSHVQAIIFKDGFISLADYENSCSSSELSERFDIFNDHIRREIQNMISYYKDECLLNDIMENLQYDKEDIGLNNDEFEKLSYAKTYDDFVNTAYDMLDEDRYNILDGIIQNIKDGIGMDNFCAKIQFVLEPDPENPIEKARFSVNINTEAPYFRSPGQILQDVGSQILQGRSREEFEAAISQEFYISEPFNPSNPEERLKIFQDFEGFLDCHAPSESTNVSPRW